MSEVEGQIKWIEKEIRETPYHKGTEHYIGLLRARLARLRDKVVEMETKSKGGGGGGYAVKKQGDATIVLVGPPSAGKSTLLNRLTNAKSKIAPYAFTTVSVIPGMMEYKNAKIQILDVPGLIEGAEEGKGRGREVLSVARGSDLLIIISDVGRERAIENIKKALERNGIRINKSRPNVTIEKKPHGGIIIHSNIKQDLSLDTIKDIAHEYGIKNAQINLKEKLTIDTYIDSLSKNRVYLDAVEVINKIDLTKTKLNKAHITYISAENNLNINLLLNEIWEKLKLINIYLVKKDDEPNMDNPMVVKNDSKLSDILELLGSDFSENKTKAIIWGSGSKFPAQEVSFSTHTQDGMMVRFI